MMMMMTMMMMMMMMMMRQTIMMPVGYFMSLAADNWNSGLPVRAGLEICK